MSDFNYVEYVRGLAFNAQDEETSNRLHEVADEIERLTSLSVTQILTKIVPGEYGMGVEVRAKSVSDVEKLLSRLGEKAEDYDLEINPLKKQLAASHAREKVLREALTHSDELLRQLPSIGFAGLAITENNMGVLEQTTDDTALRNYVADEIELYKQTVEYLWQIIDDIDTYTDIAKSDDKTFRVMVEARQKYRWKTGITTDWYALDFSKLKRVELL